jgi:hypothetical protein
VIISRSIVGPRITCGGGGGGGEGDGLGEGILCLSRWMIRICSCSLSGVGDLSLRRSIIRVVSTRTSGGEGEGSINLGLLSIVLSTVLSIVTEGSGDLSRSRSRSMIRVRVLSTGSGEILRRLITTRSCSRIGLGLRGRRRSMVSISRDRNTRGPASRLGSSRRKAGVRSRRSRSRIEISVSSYSRTGARLGGLLRRSSRRS